jgi:protein TonB
MLAYAANRPRIAARRSSPNAMLVVICVHITVVAAVMSAKMDLPRRVFDPPPKVISIPLPKDPPPRAQPTSQVPRTHQTSSTNHQQTQVQTESQRPVDTGITVDTGPIGGGGAGPISGATFPQIPKLVSVGAQLITPESELKPPYPLSMVASGEEAVLTLRLTIDANGRVVAVEPIGGAERIFLEAARRHLMAHWRYRPASEGGRSVASTIVFRLHFELDG